MKMNLRLSLLVFACLSIAPSVNAEEISKKASDLTIPNTSAQTIALESPTSSNLVAKATPKAASNQLPKAQYWYLSGSGGVGFPGDLKARDAEFVDSVNLKSGFQGSVALGYQGKSTRAELEFTRSSFKSDDLGNEFLGSVNYKANTSALLVNGYWDIPTGSKLRPYVGAGIGLAFPKIKLDIDGETFDESKTAKALTLQAKAGLQYEVTQKGNVFAEVKYTYLGKHTVKSEFSSADIDPRGAFGVSLGYRQGF